jgi:hypothetical protein
MTRELLHDLLLSFVNKDTSASRGHRRTVFVKLQRFATKKGIAAGRPWKSVAAGEWRAAWRIAEEDDEWSAALIGGPLRAIFKFILNHDAPFLMDTASTIDRPGFPAGPGIDLPVVNDSAVRIQTEPIPLGDYC